MSAALRTFQPAAVFAEWENWDPSLEVHFDISRFYALDLKFSVETDVKYIPI